VILAVLVALLVVSHSSESPAETSAPEVVIDDLVEEDAVEEVVVEEEPAWPSHLITGPGAIANPTNTAEAADSEWSKADEPCNPMLGEPWRKNGGESSIAESATLYFTPEVDGEPGLLSAIQVDFYGYLEENLVGSYFGDEKVGADGETYRSLTLSLRDYGEHDLCDTSAPISHKGLEKVTIAPDLAATNVPLLETDPELVSGWREGSCIVGMGFHWARDVVGGPDLTYEAANLMPIVPMYNSYTGVLQAVFFLATDKKQIWREGCPIDFVDLTQPCTSDITNSWDLAPGLQEANNPAGGLYMCSNFCGECQFTGSPTEMYTSMHWMFGDPGAENCAGKSNAFGLFCRNGVYPGL
jgi:hypothetical protein